ncbi:hypothetical protein EON67_07680 [archaeon]|nr:MAG: hypothetical protein EON67_07680 [archaeon]
MLLLRRLQQNWRRARTHAIQQDARLLTVKDAEKQEAKRDEMQSACSNGSMMVVRRVRRGVRACRPERPHRHE